MEKEIIEKIKKMSAKDKEKTLNLILKKIETSDMSNKADVGQKVLDVLEWSADLLG